METPVILSAVRTPVGNFQGRLSGISAPELWGKGVAGAAPPPGIDYQPIDRPVSGKLVEAGAGQKPAGEGELKGVREPGGP